MALQKTSAPQHILYSIPFSIFEICHVILAPFASLKKIETLFRLICGERKILFRLKKQVEKDGLQDKRTGPKKVTWVCRACLASV